MGFKEEKFTTFMSIYMTLLKKSFQYFTSMSSPGHPLIFGFRDGRPRPQNIF